MVTDRLEITSRISIPMEEIELSFARSGGPGGQNVNKVSSRVILRFNLMESPSLPAAARTRAAGRLARRLTKDGWIRLSVDTHREQSRNRQEALHRLQELLREAVTPPKRRVPTAPSAAARRRRLDEKRARGAVKQARRPVAD